MNEAGDINAVSDIAKDAQAELQALSREAENFASMFSGSMQAAIRSGQSFDDMLRDLGQRISAMALDRAFEPFENLLGQALTGAAGQAMNRGGTALPAVNFHLSGAEGAGIMKSRSQLAALLTRTVRRGARTL